MAVEPRLHAILIALLLVGACGQRPDVLTISGSVLGKEGEILRRQVERFETTHGVDVEIRPTPDAADQRHQLYVQWLNAWSPDPDILQLDIVWTAEFAAAGWILPLNTSDLDPRDVEDFFPATRSANEWNGRLYAVPWFVDAGMLYWRTDLMDAAPVTFTELRESAQRLLAPARVDAGLVWQGARYEGLVTVFLEHLTGFGGEILDAEGKVVVDAQAAVDALTFMRDSIATSRIVPHAVLTWQEEQARFHFQAGRAAFMRNWPYAAPLMETSADSAVRGKFAVTLMPREGGRQAAALGGAQLAINARSRQREEAWRLVRYLTAREQMIERAEAVGQFPARRSAFDDPRLQAALPIPADRVRSIIGSAVARPATPVYSQLSGILQIHLHRALSGQVPPRDALQTAAAEMRALLASAGLAR